MTPVQREPSGSDAPLPASPDAGDLLARVGDFTGRFVVLPSDDAETAVALFVLHTWAVEAAETTPYIVLASPERRSGKTKLLEVLALLVREPWHCASASEAALFRKVQLVEPTLLLDETDAIFGSHSERTEPLRALLNAGNRRGASVARVVGAKLEVKDFSVFCPKVLAGIDTGRLPETVEDRAVTLRMKRRRAGEHVERLRTRLVAPEAAALGAELKGWAAGAIDRLRDAIPELPEELGDRAGDAWEPLFAIADLAGGYWPARARSAAVNLSAAREGDEGSRGTQLLAAIRRAIGDAHAATTNELLKAINADDGLPFGGWSNGKGIDARILARLLKPYAIHPHTVRIGEKTAKGYSVASLADAWARYLPPPEASQPSQASHPAEPASPESLPGDRSVTAVTDVTDVAGATPAPTAGDNATPACAHPAHSPDWRTHPTTGRLICWRCHPPAGRPA